MIANNTSYVFKLLKEVHTHTHKVVSYQLHQSVHRNLLLTLILVGRTKLTTLKWSYHDKPRLKVPASQGCASSYCTAHA